MTRDDLMGTFQAAADRLGLDMAQRWVDIPLWRIDLRRPGLSTPVMSVHLRTFDRDVGQGVHVAFLRPGESVSNDMPVDAEGVAVPSRHHELRLGPFSDHRVVTAAFGDEARRALRLVASEVREADLRRAVLDAVGDDPDAAADLVALVMAEAGLATRLQVSLEELAAAAPSP